MRALRNVLVPLDGSVLAESALPLAPDVPALVARAAAEPTPPTAAFRRVLVPTAGTPESLAGADSAVAVLGTLGVEYTALRVRSAVPRLFTRAVTTEGAPDASRRPTRHSVPRRGWRGRVPGC